MSKYFIISILFLSQLISFGQETKLSEAIVSIAEELASDDSDPEAASTFIEKLNELAENPIKLNSSEEVEIARLFFLSDFQVKVLADYAHTSGRILSVYELVNIPGFDKETVELMVPFITLDYKTNIGKDTTIWRNTSVTNLSIRSGNDDTTTSGSPWRILTKYKFTASGLSGGFTAEKDPGEKFLSGDPPLPDFLSGYISYNGSGVIRRIVTGDYSARFGLGTNINTGIRTGLSLTAPGYMSSRDEIKPYTSTDENNFFRGMAAEFSFKNLGMNLFYSNNYSDATLSSVSGFSKDIIENFYLAGIHNTPSLLLKKDAVSDMVYGMNLSYNFANARIGFTWSGERFSLPVNPAGSDPADLFSFAGDRNNLCTVSYNALIKRILLYGELSINENKNAAFVQGLSLRPSDRLTINFLIRNYTAGFVSFHGYGPGSNKTGSNEQGITANFNFEAAKHLFISGGCDMQQFRWLKYRCSAPSWGMRQELRVRFLPTEKLTFDASYNYRYSMADNSETSGIPEQNLLITKSIKGSVRFSIYENLTLGTRIDYKLVDLSGSRGFLLMQDINYRLRSLPVSFWLRYGVFDTDNYESRIYTWENDLLYSFSIPSLYGKGNRTYLMTSWKISEKTELRFKYAISTKSENPGGIKDTEDFRIQIKITI
jgi:hypothetical protein